MPTIIYRRAEDVLHSPIGNDIVALRVDGGRCFGMEDVTAEVWRLLEAPASIEQLCDQLIERYQVDRPTCLAEVSRLIISMVAEGLVEPVKA